MSAFQVELLLFVFALLVAVYMFAAIKFPALRFLFSLRSGVASAAGVDQDKNRQLGQTPGLVLCPLIGVIAVGFAISLAMGWKADHESDQQLQASIEDRKRKDEADLVKILLEWEINEIYFDRVQRIGVSEQGAAQVERFWGRLRQEATAPEVVANSRERREMSNALRFTLKPADGSPGAAEIALLFDEGFATVSHNMRADKLSMQGFAWTLPASVKEELDSLGQLERVDLRELERQAAEAERQEHRRLNDYQEKTYAGPPAWQIYTMVNDLPEDQRQAKIDELIGASFDWECEIDSITVDGDDLVYRLSQNRPAAGRSWAVFCRVPRQEADAWPAETIRVFVRIKGEILSIGKGVHVHVNEVKSFSP